MNRLWSDSAVIVVLVGVLLTITLYSRRYVKSVADFLAARRLGGRYLLAVASGFGGGVSLVAMWEMTYASGLPPQWWQMMTLPVGLFIGLSGFIVCRFRQTRCLTLAQFFEERYSTRFRYFAGALCWLSGVLNYGIFPAVTARFIMVFLQLPEEFSLFGVTIGTYPAVMIAYLSVALYIACAGGQIGIMLTDFFQGILLLICFLILILYLMAQYDWEMVMAGLQMTPEGGSSMINPFKTDLGDDFSPVYFLIGVFSMIYNARSWQGHSGYYAAASSPHEAVMGNVIGQWRFLAFWMCMLMIPLVAYSVMHLPEFAPVADGIQTQLAGFEGQEKLQMTVPVFLSRTLPWGLTGLVAAVIISCAISCDDTYMHAWGTILVQDVLIPLRGRPLEPKQHLRWLRISIIGVGIFAFAFSMLFPLKDFILMYFALTGAIYTGGAGAVIIGGLYWKRGTTLGAWVALILGTVVGFGGLCLQQVWPNLVKLLPETDFLLRHSEKFPINGQIIYFSAMMAAIVGYILCSLLDRRKPFDLDKMLHRGEEEGDPSAAEEKTFSWNRVIGISPEFTRFEKLIFYATFSWTMFWWLVFLVGTVVCLTWDVPDAAWMKFWYVYIWISILVGAVCTVWIFCGGLRDMKKLFRNLKSQSVDEKDDGFVRKEER